MIKYLHIGYPKNFSTSLQRNLFSAHPDIYHLGIGTGSNIAYKDDLLSSAFEVYLKSAKGFKYHEVEERLKHHFNTHIKQATEKNSKAFGASSEHISFSFTYDSTDFETKISRAVSLMGNDVHVIIIIREQYELVKSLYKESVRVGLPGSFQEYLYAFYKFQDRNYYYDLRYDLVYDVLTRLLPASQIHFLTFDSYRTADKKMTVNSSGKIKLIEDICSILKLNYPNTSFEHFNEALPDQVITVKSELNKHTRHDLGNHLYSAAELHRQSPYFLNDLGLTETEPQLFADVITKRKLMAEAAEKAGDKNPTGDLFACDKQLETKIKNFYHQGNTRFTQLTGIQLPEYYYQ